MIKALILIIMNKMEDVLMIFLEVFQKGNSLYLKPIFSKELKLWLFIILIIGIISCSQSSVPQPNIVPNLTFIADGVKHYEYVPSLSTIGVSHSASWNKFYVVKWGVGRYAYRIEAFVKTDMDSQNEFLLMSIALDTDTIILNKVYDCTFLNTFLTAPRFDVFGSTYGGITNETKCELIITQFDEVKMSGKFSFLNLQCSSCTPLERPKVSITDGEFTNIDKED
jgi:hypothetical protein